MGKRHVIGKLHHVALGVADVAEASRRWSRLLGLTPSESSQNALLRCAYENYCITLEATGQPGLKYVAWELVPGITLDQARDRLQRSSTPFEAVTGPLGESALALEDPDANLQILLEHSQQTDLRPDIAKFTDVLPPFHPRRLQHVNYLTTDVGRIVSWYETTLGFRVTDWIGDEGCWMHVNSDHHVLAFLEKGIDHIHHLAFELVDWGEMRVALDHLAQHQRSLVWGPGRHTMAQNLFAYFRMSEEQLFIELFADMEVLRAEHQPRHFPDTPHSSNAWGILPPRSYFRFDDEALRSELEQREAVQGQQVGAG
jgi:catechol 2,3-dioxygenase-like lactoylglutathione lyase family enzyme